MYYDLEIALSTERVNQKLDALHHDLGTHLTKLSMTRFFCVFGAELTRQLSEQEKSILERHVAELTIYRFRCARRKE
jgi:hypothetical protein